MWKNKYLADISGGVDVRKNLIELKKLLQDEQQKKELAYELGGDFSCLTVLLRDDDPKVRKNAVLILGEMECDDLCPMIWQAYLEEKTLYVRPDYLKSLKKCDCRELLPSIREQLQTLEQMQVSQEDDKHIRQELLALQELYLKYERPRRHQFTGYEQEQEIILLTNRCHREVTAAQLPDCRKRLLAGGIRLRTADLREILPIRTYAELLFAPFGKTVLKGTPEEMAEQLIRAGLTDFLMKNHDGKTPFYFRLELRGRIEADQKTAMVKKLAAALERVSKRELLNTPSGYELEVRLLSHKDGGWIPLVRLFTIPDQRFRYRRESLPTSIAPYQAALMMQLAKSYLTEEADVLDPFCGAGTMLLERTLAQKTKSLYGVDILEEAVEKARKNAEALQVPAHFIQRDYFDFSHEYFFDEIVTNLPAEGRTRDGRTMRILYDRFLEKSEMTLKKGGILIVYTAMPELLLELLQNYRAYHLEEEFVILDQAGTKLLIIRKIL